MAMREPKWMVVIGQCGDGKSTLINNLLGRDAAVRAATGKRARGVTKEIQVYPGEPLEDGTPLMLLDTPGVGDMDVPPTVLVSMIEVALAARQLTAGGIDAVVVTVSVIDNRINLGTQVVKALVQRGFIGGNEKWRNVVLVGTKGDLATPDDIRCFDDVVREFYGEEGGGIRGPHAIVHKEDVRPLKSVLAGLPNMRIRYEPPPPEVMARTLAATLGVEETAFEDEMRGLREVLQAQSAQIAGLMAQLSEQQRAHQEEMRRSQERLQRMQEQFAEQQRQQEEAARRRDEAMRQRLQDQQNEMQARMRAHEEETRRLQDLHTRQIQEANQRAAAASAAARSGGGGGGGGGGCAIL